MSNPEDGVGVLRGEPAEALSLILRPLVLGDVLEDLGESLDLAVRAP